MSNRTRLGQLVLIVLIGMVLVAMTACRQPAAEAETTEPVVTAQEIVAEATTIPVTKPTEPTATPTTIPVREPVTTATATTEPTERAVVIMLEVPEDERPTEDDPAEEAPYPGLPRYAYAQAEKTKPTASTTVPDPDSPPRDEPPESPWVFDHYDDPPPEGTVRLVCDHNYGDIQVKLVHNTQEVEKILSIVDSFVPSDYDGGGIMGGYGVQIQVVRGGRHQCYMVLGYPYGGGYLAANEREGGIGYTTSAESLTLLLGHFGAKIS